MTYYTLPLLLGLALLQSTVMPYLKPFGVMPNLMLLAVVAWSLYRGPGEGMVWGFLGGLSVDFFSRAPLGTSALALAIVSILSSIGERTLHRNHAALPLVVILLATPVHDLIVLGILGVTGQPVAWLASLVYFTLPAAVLHVILMLPATLGLGWLHRTTLQREVHL